MALPTGTVTFLFTDIEGSTRLLHELGDRYAAVLADHHRLLRAALQPRGGHEVETQGDAFFVAFARAKDAVAAAIDAQRALSAFQWPAGVLVRVRMGLHTGEPLVTETGYVGIDVHRAARIAAAGHGQQILLSDATRALLGDDLPRETSLKDLGEHRLKDLPHAQRIVQVIVPGLQADFPPLKSVEALPNNLPAQLTSFIGREREIGETKDLLRRSRLVTLTGAGGSGKSRLALRVAGDVLDVYPDGAWWVDLAPLTDPTLVPHAVAASVGVREQPDLPLLESLTGFLRFRSILLVLDNCEHLVSACAHFADHVLRQSPKTQLLTTSREGLGTAGEALYPVAPLTLPAPQKTTTPDRAKQSEAIRLFVDRATAVLPSFRLTEQNSGAIVRICQRLDGIPLAIELAAARVRALPVEQLAARLDDRFRILTGGSRTGVARHQTLQATMDWGYQLLSAKERAMLNRLSVFAGGFTLEAVEDVCSGGAVAETEILDLVTHLVDKSLVVPGEAAGEARYQLLETVRQYARTKLLEHDEAEQVLRVHRDWYLRLAERAAPELRARDQAVWLPRLEAEHDNLRAALRWTLASSDRETALRLAGALGAFWDRHGHVVEGRQWLDETLAMSGEASPVTLARALAENAYLTETQFDFDRATTLSNEALALYKTLGDRQGMAFVLHILAVMARKKGEYDRSRVLLEESLGLYRDAGDRWGIAWSMYGLGGLARFQRDYARAVPLLTEGLDLFRAVGDRQGMAQSLYFLGLAARAQRDFGRATALGEESLALARELEDRYTAAHSLHLIGTVAWYQGQTDRASSLHQECLAMFQELGDKSCTATTLSDFGLVVQHRGELTQAEALQRDSLRRYQELGDKPGIARSLERLAGALAGSGKPDHAARLLGAAQSLRQTIGVAAAPADRPDSDRIEAAVRAALDRSSLTAAWDEGRKMTAAQAVEYALTD